MMLMNRVCNSCVGDVHKFEIGLDLWILHLGVIVLQEMERVSTVMNSYCLVHGVVYLAT